MNTHNEEPRDEAAHVDPCDGCPHCGETDMDQLIWSDDEFINCASCGFQYEIDRFRCRADEGGAQ